MKKFILVSVLSVWTNFAFAAGTEYDMRVDGLACPFCAYGIEKGFVKTEGVKSVDIDLKNGLVIVKTEEGKIFTKEELKKIIHDTGFTMKSMTEKKL
ncbi:MAG TPA: heavy-metal-associated domain-containing protein [Gammaproteobacteria bacterium]|nr:heavy-metal-associated domain-containing protein [Gammaproteobacteria bacterium]